MGEIFNFDDKLGKFKANLRDAQPFVRAGMSLFEAMSPKDREIMVGFFFTMVKADVATGLTGEDAGIFFEEIDALYEKHEVENLKMQSTCFFCENEADTGLCLKHLMQILGIKKPEDVQKFFREHIKKENTKHEH